MDALDQKITLTPLEERLLACYQRDFPLHPHPYREVGRALGVEEQEVLATLRSLRNQGVLSRVGVVVRPNRVGVSTLAAMEVPEADLERAAALVSGFGEVNHNYRREHDLNLWFVITAVDAEALQRVVQEVERTTGYEVLSLPMVEDYHIDLGFPLHGGGG